MNKNKKFILVNNQESRDLLVKLGFQEIQYDGKNWCFLNDSNKIVFSSDEMPDCHFTDKLFI